MWSKKEPPSLNRMNAHSAVQVRRAIAHFRRFSILLMERSCFFAVTPEPNPMARTDLQIFYDNVGHILEPPATWKRASLTISIRGAREKELSLSIAFFKACPSRSVMDSRRPI